MGSFPSKASDVVILSGASVSAAFYVGHGQLTGIQMPTAWTAASLTFQGSMDGVTFQDIYDPSGTEVTSTVSASQLVTVDKFTGAIWMKIRSGTSGTPVNQGADRTLTVLVQKFPIPNLR